MVEMNLGAEVLRCALYAAQHVFKFFGKLCIAARQVQRQYLFSFGTFLTNST